MRLDEAELTQWGRRIGETVEAPVVIAISGPLGAGKSVLARAIAAGAGVEVNMPSPTYTLVMRYHAERARYVTHLDLYRLTSPDELWELGWSELGEDAGIVLIEWPERAGEFLPRDRWHIDLSVAEDDATLRDVSVSRIGRPVGLAGFPMSVHEAGP